MPNTAPNMGKCLCKEESTEANPTTDSNDGRNCSLPIQPPEASVSSVGPLQNLSTVNNCQPKLLTSSSVDRLILETLGIIGSLVENEQEPPPAMVQLHVIADQEDGWLQVVSSMVRVIPLHDPLGPAVITLLLDDCPLPTKESVIRLAEVFNLSAKTAMSERGNPAIQRNICVVLGCIAEKLAGPSSVAMLTEGTLSYLIANLKVRVNPSVILFSLIALEKFAQTSENKLTIKKCLEAEVKNPLLELEKWCGINRFVRRQVGFCAQWCLDNLFIVEGRKFSFECVDMSDVNVMLNTNDVSEYLKISPNGLEARCDAYSFESVRCTFQVDTGVWFYETLIITPGVMQIGWATKDSTFLNHEGYGIGDDEFSLAYDGCRCLIWHNARHEPQNQKCWHPGDTLGCLLDLNKQEVMFYLNGVPIGPCTELFKTARSGFFAAASFMSFQQCLFNFGNKPFRFPPHGHHFQSFNDHATLSPEEKMVLPRHIRLEQLRKLSVREDSCTLCFDKPASMRLMPCTHEGFCSSCAMQLSECPMCRATIQALTHYGL